MLKIFKIDKLIYLTVGIIIGSLLSVSIAQASNTVKLVVNGEDITYKSDVPPQIINGRTLVPARALAESLGASVEWDGENNTVVVNKVKVNNVKEEEPQTTSNQFNTIKFKNMEAINYNGEIYFLAHDYENMFYEENISFLKWNKENKTFSLIINNQIISTFPYEIIDNRTYIHSEYYININQIQQ